MTDPLTHPGQLCTSGDRAGLEVAEEREADMVTRDWHGLVTILDDIYPEGTFPTLPDRADRDPGPRIVSLTRHLLATEARAREARVRLARYEAQEARIQALVAEWQALEAYAWIFFDEACSVILAALDEPEAPT